MEENKDDGRSDIYFNKIKAGRRMYYFEVKATRTNDYFVVVTESKRRLKGDKPYFENHRIFLYKEDFNRFLKGLEDVVSFIKTELMPGYDFTQLQPCHNSEGEDYGHPPFSDAQPFNDGLPFSGKSPYHDARLHEDDQQFNADNQGRSELDID